MLALIVLAIIAATIWSVVRVAWNGARGAVLLFGVGVLGIVTPIVLYARPRSLGTATVPIAALLVLVLVGSFLLRTVVILSSEAYLSATRGHSRRADGGARRLRVVAGGGASARRVKRGPG